MNDIVVDDAWFSSWNQPILRATHFPSLPPYRPLRVERRRVIDYLISPPPPPRGGVGAALAGRPRARAHQ